jgi:hypothetical protein
MKNTSELIDFITITNNIKGVSFASIKNYENSKGEVANHKINLGATLKGAKAKDLILMQNTSAKELFATTDIPSFEIFEKAFNELYNSLVPIGGKNIDGTIKVKSSRSYGQTNAYEIINPSVKVHLEYQRLYIYGLRISKEIIVEGTYPTTNKQRKTVCKDYIKKTLDFKSTKFVMYIVEGIDIMNLSKTSFHGSELSVKL